MKRTLCVGIVFGLALALARAAVSAPGDAADSGRRADKDPNVYIKVSGTVKYDDGTLIPVPAEGRISITFQEVNPKPVNGNQFSRPGSAEVDVTNGTFADVTSYRYGEGVVAGKYKVTIKAMDKNQKPLPVIPAEYSDNAKTPIEVEIDANTKPLEIKIKKPVAAPAK